MFGISIQTKMMASAKLMLYKINFGQFKIHSIQILDMLSADRHILDMLSHRYTISMCLVDRF